jgi:hypothetical protein
LSAAKFALVDRALRRAMLNQRGFAATFVIERRSARSTLRTRAILLP